MRLSVGNIPGLSLRLGCCLGFRQRFLCTAATARLSFYSLLLPSTCLLEFSRNKSQREASAGRILRGACAELNRWQGGSSIPARIKAAIKRDFEDPDPILRLVSKFLIHPRYNRQFFQFLLRSARGEADESWSVRRLALALMERQLSALNPTALPKFDKAIVSLGLKKPGDKSVAAELVGRPAKMPMAEFVLQLLRKMNRRSSAELRKARFDVELADLLHRSTQECKLILAPCAFSPQEIFERILMQVRVSEGVLSSPFAPVQKR